MHGRPDFARCSARTTGASSTRSRNTWAPLACRENQLNFISSTEYSVRSRPVWHASAIEFASSSATASTGFRGTCDDWPSARPTYCLWRSRCCRAERPMFVRSSRHGPFLVLLDSPSHALDAHASPVFAHFVRTNHAAHCLAEPLPCLQGTVTRAI